MPVEPYEAYNRISEMMDNSTDMVERSELEAEFEGSIEEPVNMLKDIGKVFEPVEGHLQII